MIQRAVQGERVVAGGCACGFHRQDPERAAARRGRGAGHHDLRAVGRNGAVAQLAAGLHRHSGDRRVAEAVAARVVVFQQIAGHRYRVEIGAVIDIAQPLIDHGAFRIGLRIVVFGHRHVVQRDRQGRGVGVAFRVADGVGEGVHRTLRRVGVRHVAVAAVGAERQGAERAAQGERGRRRIEAGGVARGVVGGDVDHRGTGIVAGADGAVGTDHVVVHHIAGDGLADIDQVAVIDRHGHIVHDPDGQGRG